MTQRSPSRSARVVRPARSEPDAGLAEQLAPADPAVEDRRDVAGDLVGRAVGEDRGRRHQQPEATRRAQRAGVGEGGPDGVRRPTRWRPRPPCSGVRCGAVQPALATMRHQSSTERSGSQCSSSQASTSLAQRRLHSRPRHAEQVEGVVAHDLAHLGLVEGVQLLHEVDRLGETLAVGPVGAEEHPLDADEVGQGPDVLLVVRRDPDVAPQHLERVLLEDPRRLVGLLLQPLRRAARPSPSRSRCWRPSASGGGGTRRR